MISEDILYNMQPVLDKYKTIWISKNCECGSNKIRRIVKEDYSETGAAGKLITIYVCANCGKEIKE